MSTNQSPDIQDDDTDTPTPTSRTIQMHDGRTLQFGQKMKIKKDYTVGPDSVTVEVNFDDGRSIILPLSIDSPLLLSAAGFGLVQKLGDAAAGADSTNDAYESILEVATRIHGDPAKGVPGRWNKGLGGPATAKGAGELVEAMVIVLSKAQGKDISKETVRDLLSQLTPSDKTALRRTSEVANAIEAVRQARGPSKSDQERATRAESILASLKGEPPQPE